MSTTSTASTASVRDVRWRYADHAVLVTSQGKLPEAATKPSKGKSAAKSSKSATGVKSPNFATSRALGRTLPARRAGRSRRQCQVAGRTAVANGWQGRALTEVSAISGSLGDWIRRAARPDFEWVAGGKCCTQF